MAHLRIMETRKDDRERLTFKLNLSKSLYRRGWKRREIIDLHRFIDWIMALPGDLEKAYHRELTKYAEEIKMPYVTTAERIGREEGRREADRRKRNDAPGHVYSFSLILKVMWKKRKSAEKH
jgi:hypothetical protein